MRTRTPSPALILAALALFVALGGTAVATSRYLITSTHQIKPSVLRALGGRSGARGAPGPQGPAGASGPQGPAGPVNLGALTIVRAPDVMVSEKNGAEATSIATCPAGSHVVSGGDYTGFATRNGGEMSADHQSWIVLVTNFSKVETNLEAIAYCAPAGGAVAASAPGLAHARAVRQAETMRARLRRERLAIQRLG